MLHSISQVFIFKYVSFVKTAFYVRVNNIVISSLVVLVLLSYWFARYRRDEVGSVAWKTFHLHMCTRHGLETLSNEYIFCVAQRYYGWIWQHVLLCSTTTVPLALTAYFAQGVCCIAVRKVFIFVVDYNRQNLSNIICVIHEDCVVCTCEEYRYK